MNSRELAINVLYKVEFGEGYSNVELDKELNKSELSALDKALASEIVYGVLTWKITLDEIIDGIFKKDNVSHLGHIIGAVCGCLFGFYLV